MCGLSFSGKTTLARRISEATGSAIVSYDDLYAHAPRDEAITGLEEWRLIVGLVHENTRTRLAAGESVVVDNLNEGVIDRDQLRAIAAEQGATTIVVFVDTPLDETDARRRRNEVSGERGYTSDEQFAFVLAQFEPPGPGERTIRYVGDEDIEVWLDELQRLVAA
jgi:predicted kinase